MEGFWTRHGTDDKGFTLVELMVVVLIIGILAMVAISTYQALTRSAARAACLSNQRTLTDAISVYQTQHDGSVPETTTLDFLEPYANTWEIISVCPLDGAPLTFEASSRTIVCPNHPFP